MHPQPVAKTIGGLAFVDPYPQLQDDTPEALAWQWEQDELARRAAEASPNYAPIRDRLLRLGAGDRFQLQPVKAGGRWFCIGRHEGDGAILLQDDLSGPAGAVVTARSIAARCGVSVATIFGVAPSPGGTYVAAAVLLDGDTVGPWSVYEVASGRHLFDTPRAPHIHGQPGWLPDETGFWLAGHNEEGLHRLRFHPTAPGAGGRSDVILPAHLAGPKHPGLTVEVSPDGRRAILVSEPHEHVALALLDLETLEVRPFLPEGATGECDGSWAGSDTYVARVNGDAPRGRVVAIPVDSSRDVRTWRELVPESEGFMTWAGVVAGRLYVGDMVDVSQRIRVADLDGGRIEVLPLAEPCALPSMSISRAMRPTEAFAFTHATFVQSSAMMLHDSATGELRCVRPPRNRLEGASAERRFATGRDGTRIPYFLVRRTDIDRTRPQPLLVHAYGGFNLSLLPDFPTEYVPFIEAGGVFVQACLRGGGEYGRAWHDAGRLAHKQTVFDDLADVAEDLIDAGVSTPVQMAFQGLSNGGLLSCVAIVQQPHLWRAVAPVVPLADMLEPFEAGPDTAVMRAVFYDDYGDPSDPQDARNIFAWSPYHNVRGGVAYPAVYQVFGENDPGCRPFHGRKFTARLRDADAGGRPIHLRVWRNTGHTPTDHAQAAAYASEWLSFLMDQVGLSYIPSRPTEAAE